jgi:hypothetical protein
MAKGKKAKKTRRQPVPVKTPADAASRRRQLTRRDTIVDATLSAVLAGEIVKYLPGPKPMPAVLPPLAFAVSETTCVTDQVQKMIALRGHGILSRQAFGRGSVTNS